MSAETVVDLKVQGCCSLIACTFILCSCSTWLCVRWHACRGEPLAHQVAVHAGHTLPQLALIWSLLMLHL